MLFLYDHVLPFYVQVKKRAKLNTSLAAQVTQISPLQHVPGGKTKRTEVQKYCMLHVGCNVQTIL